MYRENVQKIEGLKGLMDLNRLVDSASCSAATYEEEDIIPILKIKKLELRKLRNLANNTA